MKYNIFTGETLALAGLPSQKCHVNRTDARNLLNLSWQTRSNDVAPNISIMSPNCEH